MTTQSEIFESMQSMIPADLWEKYSHLSFGDMAEEPELEGYAYELRKADAEWFKAEDA